MTFNVKSVVGGNHTGKLIAEFSKNSTLFQELAKNHARKAFADRLRDDEFTKTLVEMKQRKLITPLQVQSFLQEDAFWQTRFGPSV